MMKLISKEDDRTFYKDLFTLILGTTAFAFLIGDVLIGGCVWLMHGILTGTFGSSIPIRVVLGLICAVASFAGCIIFILANKIKIIEFSPVFLGASILLAVASAAVGVSEYDSLVLWWGTTSNTFIVDLIFYTAAVVLIGKAVIKRARGNNQE